MKDFKEYLEMASQIPSGRHSDQKAAIEKTKKEEVEKRNNEINKIIDDLDKYRISIKNVQEINLDSLKKFLESVKKDKNLQDLWIFNYIDYNVNDENESLDDLGALMAIANSKDSSFENEIDNSENEDETIKKFSEKELNYNEKIFEKLKLNKENFKWESWNPYF